MDRLHRLEERHEKACDALCAKVDELLPIGTEVVIVENMNRRRTLGVVCDNARIYGNHACVVVRLASGRRVEKYYGSVWKWVKTD